MPVVGFLNGAAPELYTKFLREFRRGLNEMGFVEGQNVVVEYRWAENHSNACRSLPPNWFAAR